MTDLTARLQKILDEHDHGALGGRNLAQVLADEARAALAEAPETGDLLVRVMDTLAYYQCRETNPKADHPRMGYHAFTEDHREFLRARKREAAEEIVRMVAELSRTAPADEWETVVLGREHAGDNGSCWQVTEWEPDELGKAREMFPRSEFKLARMIVEPIGGDES